MSSLPPSRPQPRALPSSWVTAAIIGALVALYFAIGTIFGAEKGGEAAAETEAPLFTVLVQETRSAEAREQVRFSGRTEASQRVVLRAETAGRVRAVGAREGDFVRRGQAICTLESDARPAMVAEARAALAKTEADLAGAEKLYAADFAADVTVKAAKAGRDAARAAVEQAETELANAIIRAPFDAEIAALRVDPGDLLTPGAECAVLADRRQMLVIAAVPASLRERIVQGNPATVILGSVERKGSVRSIAPAAEAATRAFRVEIALDAVAGAEPLADGLQADVFVAGAASDAVTVPRSALVYATDGALGVRTVEAPASATTGTVRFMPVTLLDERRDGVMVRGLPATARVIVRGQEYVAEGTEVAFAVAGRAG